MSYQKYEKQCERKEKKNAEYLKMFEADLREVGLSEKTIARHLSNADFYINTYLVHSKMLEMKKGCYHIDDFLGDYFIRKCAWSTAGTIKSTAASLKKFYKCMESKGIIQGEDYHALSDTIKENMEVWLETCECFNDSSSDDSFW